MTNIINIERISEDRKQIFFTSSIEGEISIKVRDDFNEIPYFFKVYPGESFWISWLYSWYDKEVIFKIKNFEENFFIKGTKIDFSDEFFGSFVKKIQFQERTPLCEIMDKNGSDKGSRPEGSGLPGHNYSRLYYDLFAPFSNDLINIFELGLGTNNIDIPSNMGSDGHPCASLRSWEQFFPNGNVFGADIDLDILIDGDRSKTFYCDQNSPKIISQMWGHKDLQMEFDFIIEDGLHEFNSNVMFLENSVHKIKKGGYYIIEDISIDEIFNWKKYFDENSLRYSEFEYNFILLDCEYNRYDNNLILLKGK
jgi:hypothetical protein